MLAGAQFSGATDQFLSRATKPRVIWLIGQAQSLAWSRTHKVWRLRKKTKERNDPGRHDCCLPGIRTQNIKMLFVHAAEQYYCFVRDHSFGSQNAIFPATERYLSYLVCSITTRRAEVPLPAQPRARGVGRELGSAKATRGTRERNSFCAVPPDGAASLKTILGGVGNGRSKEGPSDAVTIILHLIRSEERWGAASLKQ